MVLMRSIDGVLRMQRFDVPRLSSQGTGRTLHTKNALVSTYLEILCKMISNRYRTPTCSKVEQCA